jgi:putative addiction module killer protein
VFGPGYRIYFGREGHDVVLLLIGGDKSSQATDIRTAQALWKAYQEATRHGTKK